MAKNVTHMSHVVPKNLGQKMPNVTRMSHKIGKKRVTRVTYVTCVSHGQKIDVTRVSKFYVTRMSLLVKFLCDMHVTFPNIWGKNPTFSPNSQKIFGPNLSPNVTRMSHKMGFEVTCMSHFYYIFIKKHIKLLKNTNFVPNSQIFLQTLFSKITLIFFPYKRLKNFLGIWEFGTK